jgi:hypothetical protein
MPMFIRRLGSIAKPMRLIQVETKAPCITREVAEQCRQLRLPFIDTAGNAYLGAPGLLVYVAGQARQPNFGKTTSAP